MSVERSELNVERSAPKGAVFLSYAREDTDAARRIADALRAFGVEVWFDQSELRGGDAWDQQIRRQIKDCALFLPIISQHTQERGEGYFRLEWKLAAERTHLMAEGRPFVLPLVVDDARENEALVPPEFMRVQWTRLAHGVPSPQFVEQVKKLLEAPKKISGGGRSLPTPPRSSIDAGTAGSGDPALHSKRTASQLLVGAIAVLAIGAALFFALKPAAPAAANLQPAVASAKVASLVNDKSIAVLPFDNMSEDKAANAFFADGIQEDVLTNLGALRELRVFSRTSVAQYRNTTKPIRQIGEELRAAYVLEGSVRRSGNRVRVTGQLIRAATDEQVWSKSYDRDITDIFAVQSELAHDIARALQAALSPQEKASLARRPTESVAAYEAYLKAREWIQKNSGLGRLVSAVALLEQAVALDPKFALAWAELGDCNALVAFEEWDRTPARLAAARTAIETAVRLAPEDPGVIAKLGSYYLHSDRDYARASEQYLRLAVLRPNDPEVLQALGRIQVRQGRWAEGAASLRRALELDPGNLDVAVYLITVLTDGRRYAEAEALARRLAAAFPERLDVEVRLAANAFLARGSTTAADAFSRRIFHPGQHQLGAAYRRSLARFRGDTQEAIRLDRESPYWEDGDPRWAQEVAAAVTLANAGDHVAARARATSALAVMEAERPQQPASSWLFAYMGMAQALLGQKEEAIANARHAMEILPESRDAVFGVENAVVLASVYAWVGEKDLALVEFARLLKTPHGTNVFTAARGSNSLNVEVSFQPLWDDPRFQALLADPQNNAPLF